MESWKEEYLVHYGVLGMKWGIRRYQNYDGTYTRRGLDRYNKAKASYDSSNSQLKSARKSKNHDEVRRLKGAKRRSKDEMISAYKQYKRGVRIEQGRSLVNQGQTIGKINSKKSAALMLSTITGYGAYTVGSSIVRSMRGRTMSRPLSAVVRGSEAVLVGSAAVYGILSTKYESDKSKIRAWYSR